MGSWWGALRGLRVFQGFSAPVGMGPGGALYAVGRWEKEEECDRINVLILYVGAFELCQVSLFYGLVSGFKLCG